MCKSCSLNSVKKIPSSAHIRKFGRFYRKSDRKWIQRYQCNQCLKVFSSATHSQQFGQKKRQLNYKIYELLCSGMSQRRIAKYLRINKNTVERKFHFMADKFKNFPVSGKCNIEEIQLDHMETWEHTKLKPLAILVVVDKKSRFIISAKVSQMPTKGLLAKKSVAKYGRFKDHRAKDLTIELDRISKEYANIRSIESDEHPYYRSRVERAFKKVEYKQYKGRRGCVTGQGEMKAGGRDPLFSLNHTCAMFRANMNRLFRRTWCTTKKRECLQKHLDLYVHYHNTKLIV